MKLYHTPTGHWAGTKDDAAALAKEHDTTFDLCDVPYDKAGLLVFLNSHRVGAALAVSTSHTPQSSEKPAESKIEPWLSEWERRMKATKDRNDAMLALEHAILAAPLETAVRLGELVMSRMRKFTI
jgi:hypothetical protein